VKAERSLESAFRIRRRAQQAASQRLLFAMADSRTHAALLASYLAAAGAASSASHESLRIVRMKHLKPAL
jgi:hypothetical protein